MTLKLIPLETPARGESKKQKSFNPGHKIKKQPQPTEEGFFKKICFQLIHFINRGSRFTYEQIDELIISLQHSILKLQKKKLGILRNKHKK